MQLRCAKWARFSGCGSTAYAKSIPFRSVDADFEAKADGAENLLQAAESGISVGSEHLVEAPGVTRVNRTLRSRSRGRLELGD